MKLPRYLKILLLLTAGLLLWVHVTDEGAENGPEMSQAAPDETRPPRQANRPLHITDDASAIADLFPVYNAPATKAAAPAPVAKVQSVAFPFRAVGLWIRNGMRIVILTDGARNWLLCDACRKAGYIRPGGLITPDWRLQAMAQGSLLFESLPGHEPYSISLNSLTTQAVTTQ
ncbi:hypothetical protein [Kosakonia cowanii]|uniref:hypothetical protein n=1 Tax=Kosakonia cowanii TaxID=208223 RepID=UPI003D972F52